MNNKIFLFFNICNIYAILLYFDDVNEIGCNSKKNYAEFADCTTLSVVFSFFYMKK
ncbi:hypothetical protein HMPREF9098_1279 [Kingella denitrificans ATCC 33394]|uniref:Uncharacterized protein n=1 Tax=Kingella denitrificans ATCC 33394 TaxID=888741 RepID=F0EZE2_9NEIS|nr:hypothetical protein HMPREF9098_1279 [Kingella denitrificans ATCC 33394]